MDIVQNIYAVTSNPSDDCSPDIQELLLKAADKIKELRKQVKELEDMLENTPNEEAEYYAELERGYAQDRI